MTDAGWPARDKTRACARCGALNGADFERCVRCGAAISARAASVDQASGALDGRSLLGTKLLIGLTLLVYAGQFAAQYSRGKEISLLGGGHKADIVRFGALDLRPDMVAEEPWRLLAAVFVHFGVIHVGMNLMGLMSLARVAEPAVGTARFTIAYVVTGIAGFAVTVLTGLISGQGAFGFTAGASGAVFGVMGLILGFMLRRRDPRWKQFAVQAVLFSVVFGFAVNSMNAGVLVNNSAHLGGLGAGILFGLLFAGPRRAGSDLLVNVGAALALLACVASLALAQLSARWQRYDMPDPFSSRAEPAAPVITLQGASPAGFGTGGREIVRPRTTV